MELTAEQFDMLYLRRSQEDLELVIEALVNDGSISAPADSPVMARAKTEQDAEREADKEAGGKGETAWEKRKAAFEAEAKEREAAEKEAAKARDKSEKETAAA